MTTPFRLGAICDVTMGQAPPGESYNSDGRGWPLVAGPGDFDGERLLVKKWTSEPGKLAHAGDIVLGIRASIGEKVVATGDCCLGRGVAGLKPTGDLLQRYLWHWLTYKKGELASKGRGATFLQVNRSDISEMVIELPGAAEQERVAAVLDQVDALRAKRREAIALLDDLVESVFFDTFGHPHLNAPEHPVVALQDLVAEDDCINYGVVQPGVDVGAAEGVPLIRSGDLDEHGIHRNSLMRISADIESKYKRSRIRGTEILVGCVGAIGAVSVVTSADVGSNIARAVARIPVQSEVDRQYLAAYLRTSFVQDYFRRELRAVAQPTLNIKQLRETSVVFPPGSERSRFVERCRMVEKCRQTHVTHLAALDELFTSLQQRAFNGTLWQDQAA